MSMHLQSKEREKKCKKVYLVCLLMRPVSLFFSTVSCYQWRTQEFCSGGVQQIQLRIENRENGHLGAVAP